MKKFYCFLIAGLCLSLGACCFMPYHIRFVNETYNSVKISYLESKFKLTNKCDSVYYTDTICHEIAAGSKTKIKFDALKMTFGDYSSFKFETPTRYICYKSNDELLKEIDTNKRRWKFIITDSLFNCRK